MNKLILTVIITTVLLSFSSINAFADPSTITKYCVNGTCNTGSTLSLPSDYTHTIRHLPLLVVSYSQACENMIKNHISGCPSLESMVPYDTSNQYISGKFVKQGNDTIRSNPQVKNHWLWYDGQKKTTVCIECVMDIAASQESKNIIIQPTSYSFADKNPDHIITTKLSYLNDRFMQGCDTATISNIPGLLSDTIHYMLSGCTQTSFNGNVTKSVHVSEWEYNNDFSTLHHDLYLKIILHGHYIFGNMTAGGLGPKECFIHDCGFIDPYKKQGY